MKFIVNKPEDKTAIVGYIENLPDGKRYDIDITLKREKRSLNQNALYWLWLTCIADETGNDKDILHDEFGKMFLPKRSGNFFGEVIEKAVSTTTLNKAQFTEYLDKIQVFVSSELGIKLPNPEDLALESFYEYYKNRL